MSNASTNAANDLLNGLLQGIIGEAEAAVDERIETRMERLYKLWCEETSDDKFVRHTLDAIKTYYTNTKGLTSGMAVYDALAPLFEGIKETLDQLETVGSQRRSTLELFGVRQPMIHTADDIADFFNRK